MAYQNGQQQAVSADQYDFEGQESEYLGSTPRGNFAPAAQQSQQQQIPAYRAVPPKDPRTGRFLKTNQQPRQQPASQQHPLQMGRRQWEEQQYQQAPQLDAEGQYAAEYGQESGQQQTPEPANHPRSLLRRAYETGFSDEEIDGMPTEALEEAVWARHRQAAEEARSQSYARALQPQSPAQQQGQQQQQNQQQQQEPPEETIDFGEFETVMDQGFVKNLKGHLTKQLKQLKTLEKKLVEQESRNQAREQAETQRQQQINFANYMDRLFSPYAEFLGDERWNELQAGDPNYAKRKAVMSIIETDQSRRTMPEKVRFAVSQLFLGGRPLQRRAPQQQQQQSQQQPQMSQRQAEWQNASLQRPTQRRPASEVNGVRKAIASVTEQLQQVSQDAGGNGMADYDDFLGGDQYQGY